ncbi:MAG TPA: hypothetical protein VF403_17785, partial [Kofleriaceae bacterium]
HFVAGTKVWAVDWYWGVGGETVRVLGRHRRSPRLILLTMENNLLTNWRAKVAYHPHVVAMLRERRAVRTQAECERLAAGWTRHAPPMVDLRDQIAQLDLALRLIRDEPRGQVLAEAAIAVLDETEPSGRSDLFVLADWLEDHGVALPFEKLCKTLKRQRDNA